MIQKTDENNVVFYTSNHEITDVVEIFINRDGNLFVKITCPKDRVTTLSLGKLELPSSIKKLGKKNFRSQSSKWISDNLTLSSLELKFGANHSYFISFRLLDRKYVRKGKFRMNELNGTAEHTQ